jgi:hypothetical protein
MTTFKSKWMDWTPENSPEMGKDGTPKTCKTGSAGFAGSIPDRSGKIQPTTPAAALVPTIDPSDRSTWPPYLLQLERISREQFGEEAARRQVAAEFAWLRTAPAEGWRILAPPIGGEECNES